ncbi:MAG: FG-GAP repeat domain-containing protein, partial [Marinicellaceae bacterium]
MNPLLQIKPFLFTVTVCALFLNLISCTGQNNTNNEQIVTLATKTSGDKETQKMILRLSNLAKHSDPMQNSFMNTKRLSLLEISNIGSISDSNIESLKILGYERLRAGNSQEAADLFQKILTYVESSPTKYDATIAQKIRSLLAISLMRIGEQANCIMLHGNDSCLFPLSSSAMHLNQKGSRDAMEQYRIMLEQDPNDIVSKWLFNIAAQTIGDYPEKIPDDLLIPMSYFESDINLPKFTNIAPDNGTNIIDLAGSSITDDFNNDGHLDIMTSAWGFSGQLRILLNDGKGQYIDKTIEAGLIGLTGGLNMVQADYDNDGDIDVLVLRGAWLIRNGRHPNSLLRNNGDGTFSDVTESAGLLSFHPTQTAAWGDIDNDGWLDIFIGNESLPNISHAGELYHNQGDGTFINIAESAGLATKGFVKGAVFGDYNNDGKIDLYVSRMNNTNQLFKNASQNNQIKFLNVAQEAGVENPIFSFPTWFWDYDNDGLLDIFVADFSPNAYGSDAKSFSESQALSILEHYLKLKEPSTHAHLYKNQGDGTFSDVTEQLGLKQPLLAMGANYGDINNDGFLDMYIGTGSPDFRTIVPNRMFINNYALSFHDVTTATVTGHLQKGHGISFADLDNDGDQDIYAVMGGAYTGDFFQNA